MSVAVERSAPAPGSAGTSNRGTGLPRRVWPTATRAACSRRGVHEACRACPGAGGSLPDQLLVGLAGGLLQRLAQQPGAEVGVPGPFAGLTPQPGPGKARVDVGDRQVRERVVPVRQPPAQRSLGVAPQPPGVAGQVAEGDLQASRPAP